MPRYHNSTELENIVIPLKNNNIKFSITIPSFKRAFFQECIESILLQTYTNFELIIVDDASPEDLVSVVKIFNDTRIRYYRNEINCGAINVVDNWNICLGYATGDYIICMGDDDRLLPNCLEEYHNMIERFPKLSVYQAWTEIIDENGKIYDMKNSLPQHESALSLMWHNWKGRGQYIGNILFDTKKLKENGGFFKLPLALSSDEISTYIAAEFGGVANSQIPLFQYRDSKQTITNTGNADILLEAVNQEEAWFKQRLNKVAANEIDMFYRDFLIKDFPKHYSKKRRAIIGRDVSNKSIFTFIKWFYNRNRYNLNLKDFVFILGSRYILKKQ
jgi:glycosyltransferase involved in cell wall biosynthesis